MKLRERFDKRDSTITILLVYAVLIIFCLAAIYPILNVFSVSLRPGNRLFQSTLRLIPENATWANYATVLFKRPFFTWVGNSLIITTFTVLFGVVISVTAGYAFARYKFYGKHASMTAFLLTQIFPAPMLLLPTYVLLSRLKLLNNYSGLIIPYIAIAVPFCVWTLKGFFDTIPISIEESAFVDGATLFQIFRKIVIPLSLPAIGVTALFSFMAAWNEYIIASIVVTKKTMMTLPVGLVSMQGTFNTDWGILSAASLLTAIPAMIIFISVSKFMVTGLTLGGVKG
jgi:arabinogalactan oligomer/maltooligosaccharide transport system permease protein